MSNAKSRLEAAGSKVTKRDGAFYVRDPRGFTQGPWDASQLEGWANAVDTSPGSLEAVTEAAPAPEPEPDPLELS